MMNRLWKTWQYLRASFWFVPMLLVLCAVVLAGGLVELDTRIDPALRRTWPQLFGVGADGSRSLLAAIAGSMITVAGVTFSITIVTLSLASSQYTSRILRNFMRDRGNQLVLGVFLAVFAYCLVVLRTIRGGDSDPFVPSVAVLVAIVLAFVGIGFLIFFIHHVADLIQASNIIEAVARETVGAVDVLFPQELGDEPEEAVDARALEALSATPWVSVAARSSGYIQRVESRALLDFAAENDTVIRMERGIGEFVVAGVPLVSVAGTRRPDDGEVRELNRAFSLGRQRSVDQDAAFGIRQLVDIALKALSPGVNDTTTANICIDYLTVILVRLARRRIESPYRVADGRIRVIARAPTFQSLLNEAFEQIRQNGEGNVRILESLLRSIETIGRATAIRRRRDALRDQVELLAETIERSVPCSFDRERTANYYRSVAGQLGATPPPRTRTGPVRQHGAIASH